MREESKDDDTDAITITATQPVSKKKKNLLWLWIVLTVIILGGAGAAFAYRGSIKNYFSPKGADTATTPSSSNGGTVTESTGTTTPASTTVTDVGVTWLIPREQLSNLNLFKGVTLDPKNDPGPGYTGTSYYKVATMTDGSEVILAEVKIEQLGTSYDLHHFLKKNNVYYWMSQNSDKIQTSFYSRTNTETNDTLILNSILPDKTITKGATVLTQNATESRKYMIESTETGTKIDDTNWGALYLLKSGDVNKTNSDVKIAQYYLLRNDGVRIIYNPNPSFRRDDATLDLTWSNTIGQNQKFSPIITSGCGAGGGSFPMMTDSDSLAAKIEAGQTSAGSKVYTVASTSTLADLIYAVYKLDGTSGKVSKETMMADLGVVLWQDDFGNWITFMNNKYAPAIECGKPVIYLYPDKDESVSVKVGASIVKSSPEYKNGWSVFAKKNGELTLDNKSYPYLFWEGQGYGLYPQITTGTIVKGGEAVSTISTQLAAMGLNKNEIADFLTYWSPKLPNAPYIRLSWLTTEQMNELAPLAVSPKPDSMIRVFLDFEGLDQKINLPTQILPKYDRTGFTLVEWGGLLVNGK